MPNETALRFHNGTFRILQLADVQETPRVSPDTLRLITRAIEREQPDLILFTGDQLYGLLPDFRFGNTEKKVRGTIRQFMAPVEACGIPFAVTYGNHDDQCGISNAAQNEIYAAYRNYVGGIKRSAADPGTFLLPILGSDGAPAFCVAALDGGRQTPLGEYLPVEEAQLDWFVRESEKLRAPAGGLLPTLVFQHIPLPEFYDLLERVPARTKGAVEAYRTHKNEFYRLPAHIREAGGFMKESPAAPDKNSGEFACFRALGNVLGVAVGHDHNNSFEGTLEGIRLIYTQCCGFHVYGPHLQRGARMFVLHEDAPAAFETYTVTYETLTKEKLSAPLLEFALTHIPTSVEQVKKWLLPALPAAALLGGGALYAAIKYASKRK